MRIREIRWLWAALGALLWVGLAAPALADGGDCREECAEARVTCRVAAHTAHRVCHEACAENDGECRKRCAWPFRLAKMRCAQEGVECRVACRPGPDCDCVAGCGEGLRECRQHLHGCLDECHAETQDALEACRELAQGGAPPEEVRACVQEAEQTGQYCGMACHHVLRCGDRFSDCVGECRGR